MAFAAISATKPEASAWPISHLMQAFVWTAAESRIRCADEASRYRVPYRTGLGRFRLGRARQGASRWFPSATVATCGPCSTTH